MVKKRFIKIGGNSSMGVIFSNTFFLTFSNIISKVLYFVLITYIARKYGPDFFGEFSVALNFITLIGVFTMLGFDTVLVREGAKDLKNADELQNSFLPVRVYLSMAFFFLSIIIVLFIDYNDNTKNLIRIISVLIFTGGHIVSGMSEHYGATFRIFQKMLPLSKIQIWRGFVILSLSSVFLIFDKLTYNIFAFIIVFASVLNLFFLYKESNHLIKNKFVFKINWNVIKPHFSPIFFFGMVTIITMYGTIIDIQIVNAYLEPSDVGIYSASKNMLNIGLLIISAFQISLYPSVSVNKDKRKFMTKLFKVFMGIIVFLIISLALTMPLISYVVIFFFGDKYIEAISCLKVLIWIMPVKLFLSFLNLIIESENKYFVRLFLTLLFAITIVILNIFLIPLKGVIGAAYAAIISYIFLLIATIGMVLFQFRKKVYV